MDHRYAFKLGNGRNADSSREKEKEKQDEGIVLPKENMFKKTTKLFKRLKPSLSFSLGLTTRKSVVLGDG